MKILHFNRIPPEAGGWIGGDYSYVQNIMKAMQPVGDYEQTYGWAPSIDQNTVDVSKVDISQFDLIHIYHVNMQWGFAMAQKCMMEGKPYIITAIYYPQIYHEMLGLLINNSLVTVAQSNNEKWELIDITGCNPEKVIVVSGGVDKTVFHPTIPDKPEEKIAVVNTGRIGPGKGILQLAESCKRLGLPYIQIGDFYNEPYGIKCLKLMTRHFQGLTPPQVAEVLNKCKLYVCPSLSDRQSLGVLEAAACGLPVVDSIYNRGADTLPSSIVVNPEDPDALDEAIRTQYWAPQNPDYVPTWEDAAEIMKPYYDRVAAPLDGVVARATIGLTDGATNLGEI